MEIPQECQQFVLVPLQDRLNLRRFLGIRDEHFEDVEGLKLDIFASIAKQIHHQFEIRFWRDVARHNREVGAIKENFTEEFQRLTFSDVVLGVYKEGERREKL